MIMNKIFEFINPNSSYNIEKEIKRYRKVVAKNNLINPEILSLESEISTTTNPSSKYDLKKKLRSSLKSIYDQINYIDYIDRGW